MLKMDSNVLTVILKKDKLLALKSKWQRFWATLRQVREGCPEEMLIELKPDLSKNDLFSKVE